MEYDHGKCCTISSKYNNYQIFVVMFSAYQDNVYEAILVFPNYDDGMTTNSCSKRQFR